jgi:hypothetical protein
MGRIIVQYIVANSLLPQQPKKKPRKPTNKKEAEGGEKKNKISGARGGREEVVETSGNLTWYQSRGPEFEPYLLHLPSISIKYSSC